MFFDDFRTEPDMATAKEHGCELTPDELREQHRWTHVIPAFDLNAGNSRGWNIVRSYDFGYGKPFLLRMVGGGLRWGDIPHTRIIRRHRYTERGTALDTRSAIRRDSTHRAGAPVAQGASA